MRTTGGAPAARPAGPGRPRHARLRPRQRLIVIGAVGVVLGILMAAALVRLTGAAPPASAPIGQTTPEPTSTGTGPPPPAADQSGVTQGVGPAAAPGADGSTGSGCPAFPRFPDESCTGYRYTGATLRPCPNVITEDGATFDGCRFGPDLEIQARDVTITRSLVEGTVYATYLTDWSLGNLRMVDVEIDGGQKVIDGRSAAIGNDDYTCIRCHVHGSERGANLGRNVHIEESYLHGWFEQPGAHQTAIGSNGGKGFTIIHNNLECDTADGCSAALSLYEDFESIDDVLIQNNLFNTSGSYCTYAGQNGTNIRYIDNVFGAQFYPRCGQYGPVTDYQPNPGNVWRGNRYSDGSEVPPSGDG